MSLHSNPKYVGFLSNSLKCEVKTAEIYNKKYSILYYEFAIEIY